MNRRGQRLRYYEEEVALLVVAAAGRDLGDAALAQQLPRRADEVDDAAQARLHVEQLLELVDLLHGCVTQTLTENKQNVDFKSERRGNWRWPMDNGGCQREMDYLKKKKDHLRWRGAPPWPPGTGLVPCRRVPRRGRCCDPEHALVSDRSVMFYVSFRNGS